MPHVNCLAIDFDFEPLVKPSIKLGFVRNFLSVFASALVYVALDVAPVSKFLFRLFEGRFCVILWLSEVLRLECFKIWIFPFEK